MANKRSKMLGRSRDKLSALSSGKSMGRDNMSLDQREASSKAPQQTSPRLCGDLCRSQPCGFREGHRHGHWTGCFFASAGFFSASFWGHPGKGRASPKVLFCQHDCWREKAHASLKVFFCQRVWCQKRPRPGKGVVLPGHGGVFLPAHLSPSASPRRNAVDLSRARGKKRREKLILRRGLCEKNCTIQQCSTAR